MAHAVGALGSWRTEDATIGLVLDTLERLRRDVPAGTATRTAVFTLVTVAHDTAECERAAAALHEIGTTHPARTIGIVTRPEPSPFGAAVSLHGYEEAGRVFWSEDIELSVGGPVIRHLHSLIEPLTLPDLPVVVWFVDEIATVSDQLLDVADALIVDARDLGDAASFAAIVEMAARTPVVDLSWHRLRPWRELLAALFEGDHRSYLHDIDTVDVRGKQGPRRLLAGWLADRLQLPASAFQIGQADHAYVRLSTTRGNRKAEFSVARRGGERALLATSEVEPDAPHHNVRMLPPAGPAWGLQEALTSLEGDPLYLRALNAATALSL